MAAGLWIGGFLQAEELRSSSGSRRARRREPVPDAGETTELAGEIVATESRAEVGATSHGRREQSREEPVR